MTNVRMDSKWPDVTVRLEAASELTVAHVTAEVNAEIQAEITKQNIVDTGNYRRSWLHQVFGLEGVVGSPVEYGVYIEYGYTQKAGQLYPKMKGNTVIGWGRTAGSSIAGRPHVSQAAKNIVTRIAAIAKDSFQ